MKWKYPLSKIEPVVDVLHDNKVVDNYRWLEDGDNPAVKKWVADQNKFSSTIIKQNGYFNLFRDELVEQYDETAFSVPVPMKNGMYIWMERKSGQNQFVIYIKNGLEGEPRALVDPNTIRKDGTASIDYWRPSIEGRYLAYGVSCGGNEIATLRIKEIISGKDLSEEIENANLSSICWMPNESGFYYTRGPRLGTVPRDDERYYTRVYQHILGEDSDEDKLVFGNGRPKEDMIGLSLTIDGRYLGIDVSQNWSRNDIYIYDTQTGKTTTLVADIDASFNLSSTIDKFILRTNYKADKYRILSMPFGPVPKAVEDWHELIPEAEHVLTGFSITSDKILVSYMVDVVSEVKIFDHEGKSQGKLPLPPFCSNNGVGCARWSKEFFFGVTSFLLPTTVYRYNQKTGEYNTYRRRDKISLDPSNYTVKQEWVTSKGNTKFPIFIVHRKDIILEGNNPTILYGYGGFNIDITPGFMSSIVPWLERGGVYASANIRGGGEYGEKWHRDGILDKKQNTFDDFIAAAEYLIDTKITRPKQLGVMGGSNGGLTVGAAMTQRPELFNAVICQVPLLDMYRFHKFLFAGRWVHEYGNPGKAKEFKWIRNWSPYHNVRHGKEYPNVLFMTANKDTRVDSLHARKMTALLQATNEDNVVLLRTEMEAGHGLGKPIKKIIESQAYILAFLAWKLGLDVTSNSRPLQNK